MESLSRFGVVRSGARTEPLGEVIIPSFTFLAAPAAIVWNNLEIALIFAGVGLVGGAITYSRIHRGTLKPAADQLLTAPGD